ncbi:MAG: FGGY family carbohydrate kinase [Bryobacteraceae bacterium]
MKLILTVDQGTTNTKVLLVDRQGAVRARASRPMSISFPQTGWVEQDAATLWTSVVEAVDECLTKGNNAEIAAIGISNQRETIMIWDRRTGAPAGPCVVWQCRRTAQRCEDLRASGLAALIQKRSGLPLDPLFSASKLAWLLDQIDGGRGRAAAGDLCAGTVDSWLLWNLTGGAVHATDVSNASRTQLLNLERAAWDEELLRAFDVPPQCLPAVYPSSHIFGYTKGQGKLPAGVPIASLIGDSHAALFGHAAFRAGSVKATYGTGSSLMTPIEVPIASAHGLSTTIAWSQGGQLRYALEGNITNTGGAVQWLADFLALPGGSAEVAERASAAGDAQGVYVVPAFAGLGAPHWDSQARAVICGLTRGATATHVARATIDSIAYQVWDVFEAIREDTGITPPALFADGGASANAQLMQFQADIAGCPVIRSSSPELSATGAAWMAGLATGYWNSLDDLEALPRQNVRYEPSMPDSRRAQLRDGWRDALNRTLTSAGSR